MISKIYIENKQLHHLMTGDFNKNKVGFLVMNVKKDKLETTCNKRK
jgi:hypothetical protein